MNALTHARATAPEATESDSLDERIELVRAAREQADVAMTVGYHQLLEARDEIDRLRRQLIEAKLEYFTREQFAERLGISVDTLDGLVRAKKVPYCRFSARLKRFTSVHLAEVARLLEVKAGGQKPGVRGQIRRVA